MKRSKNILKKAAVVTMMATMVVGNMTTSAFAYGEKDAGASTFSSDTDSNTDYNSWLDSTWKRSGAGEYANSGRIALTPGSDESDLNFAWYSATKGTPAVKVWKDGAFGSAKVVPGTATAISAENWQGSTYTASNKVSVNDYFVADTQYHYQYTDNYTGDSTTTWSDTYDYKTSNSSSFSVILTGDPQIGASGSGSDHSADDTSVSRDTYNWNKTMTQAMTTCPNAAFLLSAGDQINNSNADTADDKKTRESEYAGYLYPSVFRSLPIASTIGNHDLAGVDYTQHFNNPNSSANLGATEAGGDYYFSYGDVLFISLNSNNRNQAEHRTLMTSALESNPTAKWKVVVFHSDIYGSGQPHADTDATANRVVFAPLMDEFDIDICLTGHDHTYSRSYQILDGNVVDYDISSGSVADPEGTLYITTGSGSGSKYYNLLNYTPYYIAERTNDCLPSFSTIDFTSGSLTIKTYDYNGAKYADDFTITKSADAMTVDEVIENANAKLADAANYTDDSVAALKTPLTTLTTMKAAYTTAEDPMVSTISTGFGTSSDIIKGYGSVVSSTNKDMGTANRLKKGMSTLLDKTIYSQISDGAVIANATLPIVSATTLNNAKTAVVKAMSALVVKEEVKTTEAATEPATQATSDTKAADDSTKSEDGVQTGDSTSPMKVLGLGMSMMAALAGAAYIATRKKEEMCEK